MRALALTLALVAVVGCKKGESEGEPGRGKAEPTVPRLTETESTRARDACQAFKQRACACATGRPDDADMATACRGADGRLEALELQLKVVTSDGEMDQRDRAVVQSEIRKIEKACIEDLAPIDAACPRER